MADKFTKFAGIFPVERAATTKGDAISLEEFAQADYAVEQAYKFNYAPLVERLRNAEPLRLELNVAADIIEGKRKRPKHRTAQPEVLRSRQFYLALCVAVKLSEGNLHKAAVSKVAEDERVSVSTVSAAVRENPDVFAGCPSK